MFRYHLVHSNHLFDLFSNCSLGYALKNCLKLNIFYLEAHVNHGSGILHFYIFYSIIYYTKNAVKIIFAFQKKQLEVECYNEMLFKGFLAYVSFMKHDYQFKEGHMVLIMFDKSVLLASNTAQFKI